MQIPNKSQQNRLEGRITTWKDDKGFGFIQPAGGGDQVFLHIRAFTRRDKRPAVGQVVTFEMEMDKAQRLRAARVAFAHQRLDPLAARKGMAQPSPPADRPLVPVLTAIVYMGGLVALVVIRKMHWAIPAFVLAASVATFLVYGADKASAEKGGWRSAELNLHFWSLIGGWPGAWIAQRVFRHKSKKVAFQQTFWVTVIFNCAAIAVIASPPGRDLLQAWIGTLR